MPLNLKARLRKGPSVSLQGMICLHLLDRHSAGASVFLRGWSVHALNGLVRIFSGHEDLKISFSYSFSTTGSLRAGRLP